MNSIYQCPVCGAPLQRQEKSWRCEAGHSFDIAREGYVNLLLSQHKKSKQAGDSKMMVQARRQFLNNHHYDVLPEGVVKALSEYAGDGGKSLLDLGCGEGYYTGYIKHHLPAYKVSGVDISKPAIAVAAKRYQEIEFFVASAYRLPVVDNSVDVAVKIYAPADSGEISRCVKSGGLYISVIPGKSHLYGLKSLIYDAPQQHDEEDEMPAGFCLQDRVVLADKMLLTSSQDITNLLAMTPYYWHLPPERQEAIAALTSLETDINFVINIYKKISGE